MTKREDNRPKAKGERLQKILARAGIASRRAAEALIAEGRVRVNGVVVRELGTRADPSHDRVEVDGEKLVRETPVYVLLHKPRGVVSTVSDPEGRPCVGDMLGTLGVRAYPVGRLDFATSGALLATNDGDFANGLLHPRGGVPKTYVCKVSGKMEPKDLERWRRGVELEDGKTLPAEVSLLRHEEGAQRGRDEADGSEPGARRGDARPKTWIELSIREGRNQQIRRMGEATGFPVMRLARTSFAGVTTEGLPPGRWRYLTRQELVDLKKAYGVPKRIPHQLPQGGGEGMTVRSERGERRRGGFARSEGESTGGARYGFGAPGRRPADVEEDYGGGIQRGASGERETFRSRQDQRPEPRQDQRRGRGAAPMRTTGTGGGIGAGGGSYAKPRRKRSPR